MVFLDFAGFFTLFSRGTCGIFMRFCLLALVFMQNTLQNSFHRGARFADETTYRAQNDDKILGASPVPIPGAASAVHGDGSADGGGGEGLAPVCRVSGSGPARDAQAKTRLTTKSSTSGPQADGRILDFSKYRKRSFKRAVRRARLHGTTSYNGRLVTEGMLVGNTSAQTSSQTSATTSRRRRSEQDAERSSTSRSSSATLSFATWNCGGLSGIKDEFFVWAAEQPFQVIILQETWFRSDMDYTSHGWLCLHTGLGTEPKRAHAGVMILLRKSCFIEGSVRSHAAVPGRLLLVKARSKQLGWLSIVGLYQHAWGCQTEQQAIQDKRDLLWQSLRTLLGQTPSAHTLVVGGDFNASLNPLPPWLGPGMMQAKTLSPDAEVVEGLLRDFDLRACNTYGRTHSATYVQPTTQGNRRSFIDYILIRRGRQHVLQSGPVRNCEVGRWRGGGRHTPQFATLQVQRFRAQRAQPAAEWPRWKCALLQKAVVENPELGKAYGERVRHSLTQSQEYTADSLNQLLLDAGRQVFSIKRPPALPPPWEAEAHTSTIKTMWQHYRAMRTQARTTWGSAALPHVLKAWIHHFRFVRMHKLVQRHSRRLRRERFHKLLEEARDQDQQGRPQAIFDILRRFTPKQPRQRRQLRDKAGRLLDPAEEAKALAEFWKSVNGTSACPVKVHCELKYTITWEELATELLHLKAGKAAPAHFAPHLLWQLATPHLEQFVSEHILQVWRDDHVSIDPSWPSAWLIFLKKAGKSGADPSHLRPISLLEPLGKAVSGVLKRHLFPYVADRVLDLPLFGYMPRRSPLQALMIVFSHCSSVRTRAQASKRSYYALKQGNQAAKCGGGLQISLDCSKAFDCINRALLEEAMGLLDVPADLQDILLKWTAATSYHIVQDSDDHHFGSDKGVRQGCRLSPTLWLCISYVIVHKIEAALGSGWCREHLVGFADDIHLRWEFTEAAQLHDALSQADQVLSLLESLGLTLNKEKSVCLLKIAGSQAPSLHRKLSRKTEQGRQLHISERWQLPWKAQHVYLGACISYGSFELENAQHRAKAGKAAYARLRGALHAHGILPLRKRLALWQHMVITSTLYSITASGLNRKAYDLLRVMLTKQARAIAKSPRHLDLESDAKFWVRVGLEPLDALYQRQLHRLQQATQTLQTQLDPRDAGISPVIRQHEQRLQVQASQLFEEAMQARETAGAHVCPECSASFDYAEGLRAHIAKVHRRGQRPETLATFDRQLHGTNGLPQCSGCKQAFERWADLQKHIQEHHCQRPISLRPAELTSAPQLSYLQQVQKGMIVQSLATLETDQNIREELKNHCALCRQWMPSEKYAKQHWTRVHGEHMESHRAATFQWRRKYVNRVQARCGLCGACTTKGADHRDTCPILFQFTMIKAMTEGLEDARSESGIVVAEALPSKDFATQFGMHCQVCRKQLTARGMRKHMADAHPSLWASLASHVDRLCATWAPQLQKQCQYCGGGYKRKDQHASACPAIFQSALARAREAIGGGEPSSSTGGINECPKDGDGTANHVRDARPEAESRGGSRASKGSATQNSQDRRQQRQGQGAQTEDCQARRGEQRRVGGIAAFFSPTGGSGRAGGPDRGDDATHGPPAVEARRGYPSVEAINRICTVGSDRACSDPPACSGSGQALEGASGAAGQPNVHDQPSFHPAVDHATSVRGVRGAGFQGGGAQAACGSARVAHSHKRVGLSGMGSHRKGAEDRRGASAHGPHDFDDIAQGAQGAGNARHDRQVSLNEAHPGRNQRPTGDLHSGRLLQDRSLERDVQQAVSADRVECAAGGGSADQEGGLQALSGHPEAPRDDPLMRLRLVNTANYCYANSVIRCLLWLGRTGDDESFFSRQGIAALKPVLDHRDRRHSLWNHLTWRFLMQAWREPSRQHDAAEFYSFVVPKVCLSSLIEGEWSARTQVADSTQEVEKGSCLQALSFALDGSDQHDCQYLVHQWHNQAANHALSRPPRILVIRFAREAGDSQKDTSAIHWAPRLHMPAYTGQGRESTNVCYQVCAAVLHHGPNMQAGHYTNYWQTGQQLWVCDDDSAAQALPLTLAFSNGAGCKHCSREVYLLFCQRDDDEVTEWS